MKGGTTIEHARGLGPLDPATPAEATMKILKTRDWREIAIQLGALVAHIWAVVHHSYRLVLAIGGKEMPRGL